MSHPTLNTFQNVCFVVHIILGFVAQDMSVETVQLPQHLHLVEIHK